MKDVQDILTETDTITGHTTSLTDFVKVADTFDTFARTAMVSMKGSEWSSENVYQSIGSAKKSLQASTWGLNKLVFDSF